ncbi:MAG: DegT/DnrJ/EryC1/StrS family aminotransferase [Christensenella sp.]
MDYVDSIWDKKWLTNQGPLHQKFEAALKDYLNVNNITLTVNGHLALEIAIKGLGLTGEVITTPYTFASTVHSIALNGLTPVFCDIKSSDLTLDEEKLESLITEKTSAIMPVHVYGHICNVDKIAAIAEKHNLKVIYDAAHAFGVVKNGKSIADYGDVSMFSFHATKLFHSIEGGALVYKENTLKKVFDDYKNFGIHDEEHVDYIGGNAKMNEFQSAMGLSNLPYITDIIAERKTITLRYREQLQSVLGLTLFYPDNEPGVQYNYAYLPVLIDEQIFGISRNELYEKLKSDNIFVRKYFYPIATQYACYQNISKEAHVPVALNTSNCVLTLPIYSGMELDIVDYVCDCIKKYSKS